VKGQNQDRLSYKLKNMSVKPKKDKAYMTGETFESGVLTFQGN